MSNDVLILSDRQVRHCLDCLDMSTAVTVVENVLRAHAEGRAVMPPKLHMNLAAQGVQSWTNAMPAYLAPGDLMSLKWIGGFAENPAAGRPYIAGQIMLANARTGALLCVMEGSQITSVRTGAAAAVAAKYLAPRGPVTVALIGAGVQGHSVLQAFACALTLKEVRVVDADRQKADALARQFRAKSGLTAAGVQSPEQAVRGAEVVVTATPADEPLVHAAWLTRGVLVLTLGSYREAEDAVFTSADKLIVDNWEQAQHRGSLNSLVERGLVTRTSVWGELGDIVIGKLAGRERDDERIVCCEVGMGSEDLAVAGQVYQMARQGRIGQAVAFYES
jgi:ornithine cyclodeaminase/alanine dehydrogenase-like protein (mu-crystallin family)